MLRTVGTLVLVGFGLVGCKAEKAGDPCDKLLQSICRHPLSCVDLGTRKVCASTCDTGESGQKLCSDPRMTPADVEYKRNGASLGGAGCFCVPK